MIQSKSPYSQKVLRQFDPISNRQLTNKIKASSNAFSTLLSTSFAQRSTWMVEAANLLERSKEKYGRLITLEMGKLIKESILEVEKCAWVCRYYAQYAEQFMMEESIETDATRSLIAYQPLGPVLAIMPWNFPFWQVFRFAAPALMSGNTGLLKHASNAPQCALAIQDIFEQAGFPKGAFNTLLIDSDQVEHVISNPSIKAVTVTGSEQAGSSVAALAGKYLKKTVLELGGSDPYIVLADADLEQAVPVCVTARMINCGQSCIAAKRFIVLENLYDDFVARFMDSLTTFTFGDPLDPETTLAPMASIHHRQELHRQVLLASKKGAKIVCGGKIPGGLSGAFYPPTILTGVSQKNPVFLEELFGPVSTIYKVRSEEEALSIANATHFGLGAAIFSRNIRHAEELARTKIEAGSCFVNSQVKSDPRLPFGGIKNSGYGRELSKYGLREFTNMKTIYLK